jgi:predicted nuclease of predicted toxin-antitoxin system
LKILIDAQLPPGLKVTLAAAGHEANHVVDVGLRDADDAQVWEYAVREGIIILTKDEDFAARRLREPHGPSNCPRALRSYDG